MTMENSDEHRFGVFKIQSNAPKRYSVRPVQGCLAPGEFLSLRFVRKPPQSQDAHKDKFMVQVAMVDHAVHEGIAGVIKAMPDDQVAKHLLSCQLTGIPARGGGAVDHLEPAPDHGPAPALTSADSGHGTARSPAPAAAGPATDASPQPAISKYGGRLSDADLSVLKDLLRRPGSGGRGEGEEASSTPAPAPASMPAPVSASSPASAPFTAPATVDASTSSAPAPAPASAPAPAPASTVVDMESRLRPAGKPSPPPAHAPHVATGSGVALAPTGSAIADGSVCGSLLVLGAGSEGGAMAHVPLAQFSAAAGPEAPPPSREVAFLLMKNCSPHARDKLAQHEIAHLRGVRAEVDASQWSAWMQGARSARRQCLADASAQAAVVRPTDAAPSAPATPAASTAGVGSRAAAGWSAYATPATTPQARATRDPPPLRGSLSAHHQDLQPRQDEGEGEWPGFRAQVHTPEHGPSPPATPHLHRGRSPQPQQQRAIDPGSAVRRKRLAVVPTAEGGAGPEAQPAVAADAEEGADGRPPTPAGLPQAVLRRMQERGESPTKPQAAPAAAARVSRRGTLTPGPRRPTGSLGRGRGRDSTPKRSSTPAGTRVGGAVVARGAGERGKTGGGGRRSVHSAPRVGARARVEERSGPSARIGTAERASWRPARTGRAWEGDGTGARAAAEEPPAPGPSHPNQAPSAPGSRRVGVAAGVDSLGPLAPPEVSAAAPAVRDHIHALEERLASLDAARALEATQLATAQREAETARADLSDAQRRLQEQQRRVVQLQWRARELEGVSPDAQLRSRAEAAQARARALRAEVPPLRAAVETAFRQAAADVATVAREAALAHGTRRLHRAVAQNRAVPRSPTSPGDGPVNGLGAVKGTVEGVAGRGGQDPIPGGADTALANGGGAVEGPATAEGPSRDAAQATTPPPAAAAAAGLSAGCAAESAASHAASHAAPADAVQGVVGVDAVVGAAERAGERVGRSRHRATAAALPRVVAVCRVRSHPAYQPGGDSGGRRAMGDPRASPLVLRSTEAVDLWRGHEVRSFTLHRVFSPSEGVGPVAELASDAVPRVLRGANVCLISMGDATSGKTRLLFGGGGGGGSSSGGYGEAGAGSSCVAEAAVRRLFAEVAGLRAEGRDAEVTVSAVEVLGEEVTDLLYKPSGQGQGRRGQADAAGTATQGTWVRLHTAQDYRRVMEVVAARRTAPPRAAASLRRAGLPHPHAHCVVVVAASAVGAEGRREVPGGKLSFVDAACSDRAPRGDSGAEAGRAAQLAQKSLLALGDVLTALAARRPHVPYRNSKLTYLLQGSLGAKSSSIVLANVNPDPKRYLDTMGTLLVASQLRTASRGGEGGPGGLTLSRAGTVEAVRRLETVEDIL